MLPYYPQPVWCLGPFTLEPYGVLLALGILLGVRLTLRWAEQAEIAGEEIRAGIWLALGFGFPIAFVIDVIANRPQDLEALGWAAFDPRRVSLSSLGGVVGAAFGLGLYFGWRRKAWLRHADVIVPGFVCGLVFGRLGCALAHDHLGRLTDFPLAFAYPDGARHNLGFYEFLWLALAVFPAVWLTHRRGPWKVGIQVAVACLAYAPARLLLDFLRATDNPGADPRYLGLTFAQYVSIALMALGAALLRRARRHPEPRSELRTPPAGPVP